MPAITIKSLPDAVYQAVKKRALQNRRSLNNEIIVCIEQSLQQSIQTPRTPSETREILRRIRKLRKLCKGGPVTDEYLEMAKNVGRM